MEATFASAMFIGRQSVVQFQTCGFILRIPPLCLKSPFIHRKKSVFVYGAGKKSSKFGLTELSDGSLLFSFDERESDSDTGKKGTSTEASGVSQASLPPRKKSAFVKHSPITKRTKVPEAPISDSEAVSAHTPVLPSRLPSNFSKRSPISKPARPLKVESAEPSEPDGESSSEDRLPPTSKKARKPRGKAAAKSGPQSSKSKASAFSPHSREEPSPQLPPPRQLSDFLKRSPIPAVGSFRHVKQSTEASAELKTLLLAITKNSPASAHESTPAELSDAPKLPPRQASQYSKRPLVSRRPAREAPQAGAEVTQVENGVQSEGELPKEGELTAQEAPAEVQPKKRRGRKPKKEKLGESEGSSASEDEGLSDLKEDWSEGLKEGQVQEVEAESEKEGSSDPATREGLQRLTLAKLKLMAKENGLRGYSLLKKAELIDFILSS